MLKTIISTFFISLLLMLTACTNNGKEDEIKEEEVMNLEQLPYFSNLSDNNPVVTIEVEGLGVMTAQLFPEIAPNTVNNFIQYILDEEFNGSIFHRVIKGFMIQGGMVKNSRDPIKGEFASNGFNNVLKHHKGVLSMARTMFPNSATSQFFVMHETSPHLDGEYAGFGGLVSGFDVLDKIATSATDRADKPLKDIVIKAVMVNLNGYSVSEVIY